MGSSGRNRHWRRCPHGAGTGCCSRYSGRADRARRCDRRCGWRCRWGTERYRRCRGSAGGRRGCNWCCSAARRTRGRSGWGRRRCWRSIRDCGGSERLRDRGRAHRCGWLCWRDGCLSRFGRRLRHRLLELSQLLMRRRRDRAGGTWHARCGCRRCGRRRQRTCGRTHARGRGRAGRAWGARHSGESRHTGSGRWRGCFCGCGFHSWKSWRRRRIYPCGWFCRPVQGWNRDAVGEHYLGQAASRRQRWDPPAHQDWSAAAEGGDHFEQLMAVNRANGHDWRFATVAGRDDCGPCLGSVP